MAPEQGELVDLGALRASPGHSTACNLPMCLRAVRSQNLSLSNSCKEMNFGQCSVLNDKLIDL